SVFPSRLLLFGILILPILMIFIALHLLDRYSHWEITDSSYFLPTHQKSQTKSVNLLIFNDTGSQIEDFIAALKSQNIIPQVTPDKNITSLPLHSAAIKVALEGKV
ncbi:ABCA6 protein, partial [Rhinopomastus cyanomelas]|nr:ABCA6 protein [Rhinopomastus cyanomelas]